MSSFQTFVTYVSSFSVNLVNLVQVTEFIRLHGKVIMNFALDGLLKIHLQALIPQIFFHLPDPESTKMKNRSCQDNLSAALNNCLIKMF